MYLSLGILLWSGKDSNRCARTCGTNYPIQCQSECEGPGAWDRVGWMLLGFYRQTIYMYFMYFNHVGIYLHSPEEMFVKITTWRCTSVGLRTNLTRAPFSVCIPWIVSPTYLRVRRSKGNTTSVFIQFSEKKMLIKLSTFRNYDCSLLNESLYM